MKKVFQIAAILFIIALISNCNCDDYKYFKIIDISADIDTKETKFDTASNTYVIEYSILLDYARRFYSHNQFKFNLINSAYATSPCPGDGYEGCNELINKINVICSHDYDSTHSANDTINSLFSFSSSDSYQNFDSLSINLADFQDYKIYSPYDYFTLTLLQKPTLNLWQEFTVEFIMSDGEVFTTKTQLLEIE